MSNTFFQVVRKIVGVFALLVTGLGQSRDHEVPDTLGGPPSQNNRKIYSQSLFTCKCEETKYVLYNNTSNFIQF